MFDNTSTTPVNGNNNRDGAINESNDSINRTNNQIPSSGTNLYDASEAAANLRSFQTEGPNDPNEAIKQFLWLQQQQQQLQHQQQQQQQQQHQQQQQQQQQRQADIHAAFASAAMAEKRLMGSKRSEDSTRSMNAGAPFMPSNFGTDAAMNMIHSQAGAGYTPPFYNPYAMPSSSQQNLLYSLGNIYPSQFSMLAGMNQGFNDSYSARQNMDLSGTAGMLDVFNSPMNGQSLIGSMANKGLKKKKVKDKDKPKRPLSSYNLFFKYERQRILKMIDDGEFVDGLTEPQDPSTNKESTPSKDSIENTNGQVVIGVKNEEDTSENKDVGSLGGKEKSADDDKEDGEEGEDTTDKERETSVSVPPKKPHGKISFENLAKLIGQRWKELSEEELAKFKEMADEDMKRYKVEIEAYLTKKQEQGEIEQQQMQSARDSYANAESDYSYLNSNRLLQHASIPDMSFQHALSQWERAQIPHDFQALKSMGFDNQYQRQLQEAQLYQRFLLNQQHENQSMYQFQQQFGADNFVPDPARATEGKKNQGEPEGKKQRIGPSPGEFSGTFDQQE